MFSKIENVKICKSDLCIEAKGKNADILVSAFVFMLICAGITALVNK
jgi:hypothetical protein